MCVRVGAQSLRYPRFISTIASRSEEAVTLFCSSPLCTSGSTFIGLYPSALFPLPTLPATPSATCTQSRPRQHYPPATSASRRRRRSKNFQRAKVLIRKAQIPLVPPFTCRARYRYAPSETASPRLCYFNQTTGISKTNLRLKPVQPLCKTSTRTN